jgi:hypothetical protein
MPKYTALGGFCGSDELYDVVAYAFSYEDALMAVEAHRLADDELYYDFYVIEANLHGMVVATNV